MLASKYGLIDLVISFLSEEVKLLCNSKVKLDKMFTNSTANILRRRLLQLSAASSLGEFSPEGSPPLRCYCLSAQNNEFKAPIHKELHILFTGEANLKKNDGSDWSDIKKIQINSIEELNG